MTSASRRLVFSSCRSSLQSLLQSPLAIPQIDDEGSRNQRRISVPRVMLSARYFSASATEGSNKKVTMQERRDNARAAAKKGAHSAGNLMKKYGPIFVGTYLAVYTATLGGLFLSVESGALDPAYVMSWVTDGSDEAKSSVQVIVEFMDHYPWTKPYAPIIERNPEMANLGVAWVATKLTEPIRLAITIPLLPRVARFLGRSTPAESVDVEETQEKEFPAENRTTQSKDKFN